MSTSFAQVMICLFAGILVIVLLTAKFRVHAFFALLIASFIVGAGVQLPLTEIINVIKEGFGHVMRSLGLIIVLGTTLGVILEHTGSTKVMAAYILKRVGEKRSAFAMSLTGFVVGLPIFCDSGYIVLSGLNKSLSAKTGIPVVVMSVSLATGLYAVHCLTPPHPGISASAGTIGVDIGKLVGIGIVVAVPAMLVGYLWARFAGRKEPQTITDTTEETTREQQLPSPLKAFLPVIVPIALIAIKSFFPLQNDAPGWIKNLLTLGDPVLALSCGVVLALLSAPFWKRETVSHLLQEAAEKAGGILVIIGAGGGFGAILAATHIGEHFSEALPLASLGLFFPFLLTFVLKTAQGSSTVAIITASSIIKPLLPALALAEGNGPLLAVLSMGAGSMMISHANDAYFWVISKFSGLEMKTMLSVYSVASIFMGVVSLLMVWLLSLFLLP